MDVCCERRYHYNCVIFRVGNELGVSALVVISEVRVAGDTLLGTEEALVRTELDLDRQGQEAAIGHLLHGLVRDRVALVRVRLHFRYPAKRTN